MAITEESRFQLHQRLERVLGKDEATTLMEHLPPVGWADVATKADIAGTKADIGLVRSDMVRELAAVRHDLTREIELSQAVLRKEIAELRGEVKAEIADFRAFVSDGFAEVHRGISQVTREAMALQGAFGLAIAILVLVLR